MKINILKEGVFKTPTQAKAAREKEQSKSSTERLAATAVEIQNNNIIKIVNDTIERHEIPLFPQDFLTRLQYYSLRKAVDDKIYYPKATIMTKYENDDLRLLKVKIEDDKLIFTMNTAFPSLVKYIKGNKEYNVISVSMGFIDNKLIVTDENIEDHKKYFLLALKYWLEYDYANDKVDDSAIKIIEYIENDKIIFDKINLFTGYDNVCFVPAEPVKFNKFDNGKFISTNSVNYGSWLGALSVMRLGKSLVKHFVFNNSGKLGFKYTHDQRGLADMTVLNSPSLKKYVDDFVSSFLTHSNTSFDKFIKKVISEGGYENKFYRDGEFVVPKREEIQIKRWLKIRQAAIDNNLIKIEKIERELITEDAILNINKETGIVTIGEDFNAENGPTRVNVIINIKLGGVPEEIALTHVLNPRHSLTYTYCTDMGANSLKKGTRTEDGYTREIYEFPDKLFPVLYANGKFNVDLIDQLQGRLYEVDNKTYTDADHTCPLEKVGKDFIEVLYLEATGEN